MFNMTQIETFHKSSIRAQPPASEIASAARILRDGGIVAFPTETVYGLGADAFNAQAVARVFEVKKRPRFDPLIVHIHDVAQLELVAESVPAGAWKLIRKFWPGPLTIVVPKRPAVADIVTAGLPNVGVRMPRHSVALELLRAAQTPIAAPSANLFGRISPTDAAHVREHLAGSVDMILDGGPCSVGIESTIVSFAGKVPMLLRPGGTPTEEIENLIGELCVPEPTSQMSASPGRSLRHYAPATPVVIATTPSILPGLRKGLLAFTPQPDYITRDFDVVEVLSHNGSLNEAACNLFAALRRLDQSKLDVIIAKKFPEQGLGRAINDRLSRASQSKRIEP